MSNARGLGPLSEEPGLPGGSPPSIAIRRVAAIADFREQPPEGKMLKKHGSIVLPHAVIE